MTFSWRYSQQLFHICNRGKSNGNSENDNIPNAKQKTKDIRLLFLVQLSDILVRTHPVGSWISFGSVSSTPLPKASIQSVPIQHQPNTMTLSRTTRRYVENDPKG